MGFFEDAQKFMAKKQQSSQNLDREYWIRQSKLLYDNATDREIEKAVDEIIESGLTDDDEIKKMLRQKLDF